MRRFDRIECEQSRSSQKCPNQSTSWLHWNCTGISGCCKGWKLFKRSDVIDGPGSGQFMAVARSISCWVRSMSGLARRPLDRLGRQVRSEMPQTNSSESVPLLLVVVRTPGHGPRQLGFASGVDPASTYIRHLGAN